MTRSSCSHTFLIICVPKNFLQIHRKILICCYFFIKKRLQYRSFPVKSTKFLRTHLSTEHLRWLLLNDTAKLVSASLSYPFISSRPLVFCNEGLLRNFANFTGKHLCQNLLFNKVAGLRLETLLKKRLWHRCFSVNL